ncbi:MAG: phage recombination protein Bet [Gammaproteobacteria bacterium]
MLSILRATAFKVKDGTVSTEQMAALLVVCDQYGLNPFTREIFAFPDKQNGIVPVVSVDGWARIINADEQFDGLEFRQAEEILNLEDAKPCPAWMEVVIYRKDRSHPVVVREYLDEVYRPVGRYSDGNKRSPGPWQSHTKRILRHKTLIQGARVAFGFGGIFDEDEAERIREMSLTGESSTPVARPLREQIKRREPEPEPQPAQAAAPEAAPPTEPDHAPEPAAEVAQAEPQGPSAAPVYDEAKLIALAGQAEDAEDLDVIRTLRDSNITDEASKRRVNKAVSDRLKVLTAKKEDA